MDSLLQPNTIDVSQPSNSTAPSQKDTTINTRFSEYQTPAATSVLSIVDDIIDSSAIQRSQQQEQGKKDDEYNPQANDPIIDEGVLKSPLCSPNKEPSHNVLAIPNSKSTLSKSELLKPFERKPRNEVEALEVQRKWVLVMGPGTSDELDPSHYDNPRSRSNRGQLPRRYREEESPKTTRSKKNQISMNKKIVKAKDDLSDGPVRLNPKEGDIQKNSFVHVEEENVKKAYGKNRQRPKDLLAQLQEDALWFSSSSFNKPKESRKRVDKIQQYADFKDVNFKDFITKEKDLDDMHYQKREKKRPKKKVKEKILGRKRMKKEDLHQVEEERRRKEELERLQKRNVESAVVLATEYKEKRYLSFKEETERLRRRARKGTKEEVRDYHSRTPIEDECGCKEEYHPFLLNIVVGNHKNPIDSSKFFVDEILNEKVIEVKEIPGLMTGKKLMDSQHKHYQQYKGNPLSRNSFVIKSCIFPNFSEEYSCKESIHHQGLDAFLEVGRTMELASESFFPPQYKKKVFNSQAPSQCISGRYSHALKVKDWISLFEEIDNYNCLVDEIHQKGEFLPYIKTLDRFSRVTIQEVLNQVYTRSVLPEANILRQYKGFSAEVYGELMPSFVSQLFSQTGLNSGSVFMDLGSGVGNVTLHAALEFGAESYGCELMENCTYLADKQLAEFKARAKAYGIIPGHVELLAGDFTRLPMVSEILTRADVVLVNNYLFDDKLNQKVLDLLSVINLGTKIISLKPVVPDAYTYRKSDGDEDDYISRLKVQRHEFRAGSVSWSNYIGDYYISELTTDIQVTKERKNTRLQRNKTTAVNSELLTPYTSDYEDYGEELLHEIKCRYVPKFSEEDILRYAELNDRKAEAQILSLENLRKINKQKELQKKIELEKKKRAKKEQIRIKKEKVFLEALEKQRLLDHDSNRPSYDIKIEATTKAADFVVAAAKAPDLGVVIHQNVEITSEGSTIATITPVPIPIPESASTSVPSALAPAAVPIATISQDRVPLPVLSTFQAQNPTPSQYFNDLLTSNYYNSSFGDIPKTTRQSLPKNENYNSIAKSVHPNFTIR